MFSKKVGLIVLLLGVFQAPPIAFSMAEKRPLEAVQTGSAEDKEAGKVTAEENPARNDDDLYESIGVATMKPDGTIEVWLRADDEATGTVGEGRFVYRPQHPEYNQIVSHLGGLRPGETKRVKPWPDSGQP